MLLAGRRSGYFWIVALSLFTTFLYSYQITHPEADWQSRLHVSPTYYYISYLSLFLIIFGVVVIFESGQSLIIQLLRDNKKQLELQQTEIVRRSQELEAIENKLRNTNLELENFAYAASHDLKEPLRMIGMYTQLIQRRIKGQLDENTTEYMYYVTDGVSRMQTLLDDLLNYSRLGKKGVVKSMDLNDTLFVVMNNLAATIKETQATIVVDHLPTVVGNSTEMIQLFQNLIANSIKFRQKESTPIIEITHTEKDETITFAFKDNGIGIKSDFHEKVFNIFERLHSHSDYEGTGIGLATCKKIVVNHGGQIWVNSEEGAGATFHFTIPKGTLAIAA
jgi:light-regulated signal transduction histidine kinase (bacteriophytochrome)